MGFKEQKLHTRLEIYFPGQNISNTNIKRDWYRIERMGTNKYLRIFKLPGSAWKKSSCLNILVPNGIYNFKIPVIFGWTCDKSKIKPWQIIEAG